MFNHKTLQMLAGLIAVLGCTWTLNARGKTLSVNCPNCDLAGADYSGQTLVNANFAGADLRNADFSRATLNGVNFQNANLTGARFDKAKINADAADPAVPTMYQSANLSNADFSQAKLNAVDFQYTDLNCTTFHKVDLSGAVFGYILHINDAAGCQTAFTESKLTCEIAAHAGSLDLRGSDLPGCHRNRSDRAPEETSVTAEEAEAGLQSMHKFVETVDVDALLRGAEAQASDAAQTVFVNPDGTDASGCGQAFASACKTIQYATAQCASSDCEVAVGYGTYELTASIAPNKGDIHIVGGYVNGTRVPNYQSRVFAPSGSAAGQPAFALSAADRGIELKSLLLMGRSAGTSNQPAASAVIRANGTGFVLQDVAVTAAEGAAATMAGGGSVGASGAPGGAGKNSNSPGSGAPSSCGAQGGKGGYTKSITANSSLTWYLACELSCDVKWYNASSGYPGGTGHSASGSALSKPNSLACYACPAGRGDLPKSAASGSDGSKGACGAGGGRSQDIAGRMDANGAWSPTVAGAGTGGKAGGGGGGGGPGGSCGYANCVCSSSRYAGGAGGGGGAGGCGATPGQGGVMGGATFAVVLASSSVVLVGAQNVFTAARSGAGGQGGPGINGGGGGKGGSGQNYSNYCNDGGASGASGGAGGAGGASGGGSGGNSGPSVNIALTGSGSAITGAPVYYAGLAGAVGAPGIAGTTTDNCTASAADSGAAGLVSNTHTF